MSSYEKIESASPPSPVSSVFKHSEQKQHRPMFKRTEKNNDAQITDQK